MRTGCSFRILLPFFLTSWSVGVLNSSIFNSFHNRLEFVTIFEGLRNLGGLNIKVFDISTSSWLNLHIVSVDAL